MTTLISQPDRAETDEYARNDADALKTSAEPALGNDVFISYSTKDKPIALAACAALESDGVRCWMAPRDIQPGADWGESIVAAIDESRIMVLIFSGNANASPQVRREVQHAFERERIVIPLRVENIMPARSLEYYLGAVHWLDAMTPPLEKHLQSLNDRIHRILATPQKTTAASNTAGTQNTAGEHTFSPPVLGASSPTRLVYFPSATKSAARAWAFRLSLAFATLLAGAASFDLILRMVRNQDEAARRQQVTTIVTDSPGDVRRSPETAPAPLITSDPPATRQATADPTTRATLSSASTIALPPHATVDPQSSNAPTSNAPSLNPPSAATRPAATQPVVVPARPDPVRPDPIVLSPQELYEQGARLLRAGDGQDKPRAAQLFRAAADAGSTDAMTALGNMYRDSDGITGDDKQAFALFTTAAQQGNSNAQVNLGWMYESGRGVQRDDKKAFYWYAKAADQNNLTGISNLASMYAGGRGVDRDLKKAAALYRSAAVAGYPTAMDRLGEALRDGDGVDQDFAQAFDWFTKAADRKNTDGMTDLASAYFQGQGCDASKPKAVELWHTAAVDGNARAMVYMARLCHLGIVVERDDKESFEWYQAAAKKGNPAAMVGLGVCFLEARHVEKDEAKARLWFQKAADLGYVVGMRHLATLDEKPGAGQDLEAAFKLYTKAADLEDIESMQKLAEIYGDARSPHHDANLARRWRTAATRARAVATLHKVSPVFESE